jgi:hypothetical protein
MSNHISDFLYGKDKMVWSLEFGVWSLEFGEKLYKVTSDQKQPSPEGAVINSPGL